MKDSGVEWIGQIPIDWEVRKLSDVAERITDFVASGSFASLKDNVEYLDEPDYAMLVRTVDLSQKMVKKPVFINESAYNFLSNSNLYGGELILPNIGSVGDIYKYVPIYQRASLAPNAILVDMKEYNQYYYYYFLSPSTSEMLKNIGSDSVQLKFNKTQLRQIRVLRPRSDEQIKIAEFLDKKMKSLSNIIEQTKSTIEDYKLLKQSIITEAVTKGLDKNVEMKDSGIEWVGDIPKHWGLRKLKYEFKIKKDIAGKDGYDVLSVTQNGLKVKDININEGQMAADYSKYQFVKVNDYVMNHMDLLTGWVDYSIYDGVTSPDYRVFSMRNPEKHSAEYFKYIFQACYKNKVFYGMAQGVSNLGRWRLQTDKFLNFYIPIPPKEEQYKIADHIVSEQKRYDQIISKKAMLLLELEKYKKSLIYEYVTGKKEVR